MKEEKTDLSGNFNFVSSQEKGKDNYQNEIELKTHNKNYEMLLYYY